MKNLSLLLLSSLFVVSALFAQNRPAPPKPTPVQAAPKSVNQPVGFVKPKVISDEQYRRILKEALAIKAGRDEVKKMEYMKKLAATSYEATFRLAPSKETNLVYYKFTLEFVNNAQKLLRLNLCYSGSISSDGRLWPTCFTEQITNDIAADDNLLKRMKNGMKNFTVKVVFKFDPNGLKDFYLSKREHGDVMVSGPKHLVSYKIYDGAILLFESGK